MESPKRLLDKFKSNVVPYVTFLAASLALLKLFLSYITESPIDIDSFLMINFLIHLVLLVSVIVTGFHYPFDVDELYRLNPNLHKNLFFVKNKTEFRNVSSKAYKSLTRILTNWIRLCMLWAFYYFLSSLDMFLEHELIKNDVIYRLSFNILNAIETGLAISCFYILNNTYVHGKSITKTPSVRLWWVLLVAMIVVDLLLKVLHEYSSWSDYSFLFDILGGVLSCAFFALIFSKLNSKFLGFKTWKIAILFFYASIQAIFPILTVFDSYYNDLYSGSDYSGEISIMINSVMLFGYYLALLSKGVLFTMIYDEKNKHKFFVYFMLIQSQTEKFNQAQETFYKLKRE